MGWFDEQLKQRMINDDSVFTEAFAEMSSVVMGKHAFDIADEDDAKQAKDAVDEILKFYHVPSQELPGKMTDLNDVLEFLLRPSGIMRRSVQLDQKWYRDGIGALLCTTEDGTVTALIPGAVSGYTYFDKNIGKRVKVNKKNCQQFSSEAICFYMPLPLRSIGVRDLVTYIIRTLSSVDYVMIVLATLAVSLIGLFSAYVNNLIFNNVISSGSISLLIAAAVFLVGVTISSTLINVTKNLVLSKINTKLSMSVSSAAMMRVLSLPAAFFKKFNSGELASRTQSVNNLCNLLTQIFLSTGLTTVFSVIYIVQIFNYAPSLVVPAICVLLFTIIFTLVCTVVQMKLSRKMLESDARESGLVFSLLSGIQKIKLSGAEKRAFAKWSKAYKSTLDDKYNPPVFIKVNGAISTFISLIGTAVIYYLAVKTNVSVAEYMTFNVAYGMVLGAFVQIATMAIQIADIKPMTDMIKPILEAEPEISTSKKVVTRLSGAIEMNNISFRYSESMPLVIDNLSLKIRPGQYVAIVGTTGCGKSTLMRLMLGFERPQKGAVYYDGKDLSVLDLKSLRRNIGTVMQNGKLFSGDVYSNIVISAPWLTLDEAWAAAEMAGIAEDIRHMPMQMHTIISEGSGGISGGQRQRLMIARAIAPKPRLLMFDEATSALDNLTQKIVSESLDKLKCTRIVIAHRLSTIKQCDRIIVLHKGKIVEDGSYNELIEKDGMFAELVARQRLDT